MLQVPAFYLWHYAHSDQFNKIITIVIYDFNKMSELILAIT